MDRVIGSYAETSSGRAHAPRSVLPQLPLALELQITKEYLGQDTHLAFLGPLYEEVLNADTYANGAGSTIARIIDGSLHGYSTTAIAGVANIGSDVNWTGSHFNQANWYAYGRMAWAPDSSAEQVADEWVRQTFSNDPLVVAPVSAMLMGSREAVVDYMTPLGLAHIMASEHHYGPGPWIDNLSRPEWNPVYYHKASAAGLGFDRTSTGSNAVGQYAPTVRERFGKRGVGWDKKLNTGKSVWEELEFRYSRGVDAVGAMRESWKGVQGRIDAKRHSEVANFLLIQHYEARWWRDACLQYFASVSKRSIPSNFAAPANTLGFYQNLTCPADVTRPRCEALNKGEPSPAILR